MIQNRRTPNPEPCGFIGCVSFQAVGEGHDPPGRNNRFLLRTYANSLQPVSCWFCSGPSRCGRVMTLPYRREPINFRLPSVGPDISGPAEGTDRCCAPMRIRSILRFYGSALSRQVSGRIYPVLIENKTPTRFRVSGFMLALPIFPGSRPPSIVGACELNFCVRDGNRWTLTAINTNSFGRVAPSFMSKLLQAPTAFGL